MLTTQTSPAPTKNEHSLFDIASPLDIIRHNHYMLNTYIEHALKDGATQEAILEAVFISSLQNEMIVELFVNLQKDDPCRS